MLLKRKEKKAIRMMKHADSRSEAEKKARNRDNAMETSCQKQILRRKF